MLAHRLDGHAELFENVFLAGGLHLLLDQGLAGLAVVDTQRDDEVRAELRDRSLDGRLGARALADFARDPAFDGFLCGPPHETQRALDALIRQQRQKWRLLQLHRHRLPQRIVEDGIARRVRKIGDEHGVAFGQTRCR